MQIPKHVNKQKNKLQLNLLPIFKTFCLCFPLAFAKLNLTHIMNVEIHVSKSLFLEHNCNILIAHCKTHDLP